MRQTWLQAHRIAHIAAAHAHSDLSVTRDGYVDVFAAIRSAGVPMMLQKMPKLFGIYVCAASAGPGILLNSGLRLVALRHTAAHELGHHRLGHGDSVDEYLDPWNGQAPGGWTGPEMSAEAFAAWFLMPPPAVRAALRTLGLPRPRTAADVYRTATMLGVSYRGLARHLVAMHLATEVESQAWARTPRSQIRRRLAGVAADACRGDVHLLTAEMGDLTVYVEPDDLLVFHHGGWPTERLAGNSGLQPIKSSTPDQLPLSAATMDTPQLWRVTADLAEPLTLRTPGHRAVTGQRTLRIRPVRVREGIDLAWLEAHEDQ